MLYVTTILPDPLVNGILVQLPLPGHLDEQEILERISQTKVRTYRWIGVKYDGLDWIIKKGGNYSLQFRFLYLFFYYYHLQFELPCPTP